MPKILILEDEIKTLSSLKQGLEEEGYAVEIATDGQTGKNLIIENSYDLLITDIIMPQLRGDELVGQIRELGIGLPVLMLTALGSIEEKLNGFDLGADDYLVKPFAFSELLARVKVLLKRYGNPPNTSQFLEYQGIKMNLTNKTVHRDSKVIDLSVREFTLLELFLKNPEKVISKQDIAEKVWDLEADSHSNVIEVYINLLRKKIDKGFSQRLIHTQYGMGYVLRAE